VAKTKLKPKPKAKAKSAARTVKRPAKAKSKRTKWLDPRTKSPLIDGYARKMGSFLKALADGRVDAGEVKQQEARVAALMKRVEPKLDDQLHAQMTQLLCELTVYDLMQTLYHVSSARPTTQFRG
jgi:hypothetical protein